MAEKENLINKELEELEFYTSSVENNFSIMEKKQIVLETELKLMKDTKNNLT